MCKCVCTYVIKKETNWGGRNWKGENRQRRHLTFYYVLSIIIHIHLKNVWTLVFSVFTLAELKLDILRMIQRKATMTTEELLKALCFTWGFEGNLYFPWQQSTNKVKYISKISFSWWFGNLLIHVQVWMTAIKITYI